MHATFIHCGITILFSAMLSALSAAEAQLPMPTPAVELPSSVQVRKIWDNAPHNAFTDLCRYKDRWFCVFREGNGHVSPDGAVRVLSSRDGAQWESAALLTDPKADLRDPKLAVTPDNRLMIIAAAALPQPGPVRHQTMVWHSQNGSEWEAPTPVGDPNQWLWRITWHGANAYGVGYDTMGENFIRLYQSHNGKNFSTVVPDLFHEGNPNETALVFLPDETCLCLLRRDGPNANALLGAARPPYRDWTWKDLGKKLGGPNLIRLPDGRLLAAGRLYDGGARASLMWLDEQAGRLTEILRLPSGGDCSYPGLAWHDDQLWVSYYSSHEGKTSIYLATVKFAQGKVPDKASDHATPLDQRTPAPRSDATTKPAHTWLLTPMPRRMQLDAAEFKLPAGPIQWESGPASPESQARLTKLLEQTVRQFGPFVKEAQATGSAPAPGTPKTVVKLDAAQIDHPQGYNLGIDETGIRIAARDEPGVFYAAMTLRQIARLAAINRALARITLADWPDFPHRGVILDIARDKVPAMETLFALMDKLAEWKINQFQLYTEHTFAYRDHARVWQNASPMTPVQIRQLDAYCRERFIELVPNQNSFGHMDRWLQYAAYQPLGEMPEGGSDLCPADPHAVAFLKGLYDDLLPNFSSGMFNACCDETWSLGKGRSKDLVAAKGEGRVYLDFLMQIRGLVRGHDKRMQFWGDIIMNHRELIPDVPKDMIALEWGYEARHPFAEHGKEFAKAGIEFYVAPGTSSWNSLVGRTENAVANLRNAAENGLANGAQGYLITDWGDSGHWQCLPVSYLGYLYGAAVSWCAEANTNLNVPQALDLHAFADAAGVMGRLAYDLGNAYRKTGVDVGNNTPFYGLLLYSTEEPLAKSWLKPLTVASLDQTLAFVDAVMSRLPEARMSCPDAVGVQQEFLLGADLVRFACRLGLARVKAGGVGTSALTGAERRKLADELAPLLPRYREIWLRRNRSGGLSDSVGRFENLLAKLRKE